MHMRNYVFNLCFIVISGNRTAFLIVFKDSCELNGVICTYAENSSGLSISLLCKGTLILKINNL